MKELWWQADKAFLTPSDTSTWMNRPFSPEFVFYSHCNLASCNLVIAPRFRTLPDTEVPELISQLSLTSQIYHGHRVSTLLLNILPPPLTQHSSLESFRSHCAFVDLGASYVRSKILLAFAKLLPCSLYQGLLGLHIMNHQNPYKIIRAGGITFPLLIASEILAHSTLLH